MNAPINPAQLQPPAGKDFPYTPSCFQMEPQQGSVEGWIGWGPTINGQHQTWLGLPGSLDINQVYKTMDEYGLCITNGQEVPFVAVQAQAVTTTTDPLERLRQASVATQEVEQPTQALTPLEQRQQALEVQQANTPVDADTPAPPGSGPVPFLIAIGCIGASIYAALQDRTPAPQIPDYQPEEDLPEEVAHIEHEQVTVSATPRIHSLVAPVAVRPSPWAHAYNPYTASVSVETKIETGLETALETDRNSVETDRNSVETDRNVSIFSRNRVETDDLKIETETPVSNLVSNVSKKNTPSPEVVDFLMAEIRARTGQPDRVVEELPPATKREQEMGPRGSYEINLESGAIANEEAAKQVCFGLLNEGVSSTTKLMWRVFGIGGGTNKLYQSGLPQQFIEQWKTEWEGTDG